MMVDCRILHHQPVHQTWRQFFSPTLESNEVHGEPEINNDAGSNEDLDPSILGADDSDDNSKSSSEYQTCIVSNFYISDMIVAGLPIEGNSIYDDITEASCLIDYKFDVPSTFFDVAKEYMIQPFLEDTMECFDPHMFIRNLPDLPDVVPNFHPTTLLNETQKMQSTTLVLDLDAFTCAKTLVHSTLEHCEDADFSFPVFFNMKEHRVYVKQRHYLQMFLERVAEMFEIVVFTASQSIYAEQLLDIMDPDRKLISRRAYRESCIFLDGSYTEDLTVLGVDLAKIAIIDNSLWANFLPIDFYVSFVKNI
ncbi:CTD small phosphatase-like protein 2 [Camellia sinensis]|uniref:CTD small phosphatase-like protein 2 n=1 Tax=Camellia sinensis TaxID=4442 RepID=UPI001035FE98|nr:CTD small phosphatase-like protein 2 [Camellia sinensis]